MLSRARRAASRSSSCSSASRCSPILLGLGAPAMGTYLQNSKLASAAASYYNGLQMARTEAIRRNVQDRVRPDGHGGLGSRSGQHRGAARSAAGTGSCGRRRARASWLSKRRPCGADGSAGAAAIQVSGSGLGAGASRQDPVQRLRRHRRRRAVPDRHLEPGRGHLRAAGGKIRCRRITVSPGGQVAACDPAASAAAGDSRACSVTSERAARRNGGFFLIEAMVAILIFALGILGLVAMGGTAVVVAVRCAVPHRGEQPRRRHRRARWPSASIAPSEATKAASLANFAHQATSARRRRCRAPCAFTRHGAHRRDRRRGVARSAAAAPPIGPPARAAGGDGGQPADLRRRRRQLQPGRDHAVLEDRERQRLAPSHARHLRQLRSTWRATHRFIAAPSRARPVAGRDPGRRRDRADRHRRDLPGGRGLDQAHADDELRRRCAGRRHAGALQHRARPEAGRPRLRQGGARRCMGCQVSVTTADRRRAPSTSACARSRSPPAPAARPTGSASSTATRRSTSPRAASPTRPRSTQEAAPPRRLQEGRSGGHRRQRGRIGRDGDVPADRDHRRHRPRRLHGRPHRPSVHELLPRGVGASGRRRA